MDIMEHITANLEERISHREAGDILRRERNKAIRKAHKKGHSITDIARQAKMSRQGVYNVLHAN